MKRLVIVIFFLSLCTLIGVPSNKILFEHPNNGVISLPLNSILDSFGLEVCDQETIKKQSKKKNYRKIKKGIKTFTKRYKQYKNDDQKQIFEKAHNQCLLPASIPGSDLIEISETNLKEIELGEEQLFCLKSEPGSFIKPSDFYAYKSNIKAYLKAIKVNQKVKTIKQKLVKSDRGSREYKVLKKKLRAALLERKAQKLLISYSELLQEICKKEKSENRVFSEKEDSDKKFLIYPEPFPNTEQTKNPVLTLGEAPSFTEDEIQQMVGPPTLTLEEISESESAVSVPVSGFTIDTTSRSNTLRAYHRYFLASEEYKKYGNNGNPLSENPYISWDGDVENCIPGSISQDAHNDTLRRVNYYRAMTGLSSNIYFVQTKNEIAQETALIMAHQGRLSHVPDFDFPHNPCLTENGIEGAGRSNLSLGRSHMDAINAYMLDNGGGQNRAAPHRRWMLFSQAREMGNGYIPPNFDLVPLPSFIHNPGHALFVFGDFKPAPPPIGIKYPNEGYAPWSTIPYGSKILSNINQRWSYGYPNADFFNASVVVTKNGAILPITEHPVGDGHGDNTIVWDVHGLPGEAPGTDQTYNVVITGATLYGEPLHISYSVTVFDPYNLNEEVSIFGTNTPNTGSINQYSFSTINDIDSYQLRISRIEASTWTEGAETSPAPKIIDNTHSTYNLYTQDLVNTGTRAFHLTIPGYQLGDQTFVIDRVLVPSASSRLEFVNRFRYVALATELTAEISTDDGETWTNLWSRFGDANSSSGSPFTWETEWQPVSIDIPSEYEGEVVLIRFHLKHNNSAFTGTSDQLGAFIDDIGVTNTEEHFVDSTRVINKSANSFDFTPTQADTTYWLEIQPEVEGHYFGYGPKKIVTSIDSIPNTRPIANAGSPQTITLPDNMVILDGSNSFDAEQASDTLTYTWTGPNISENGMNPTLFFDKPGVYDISLVVTDNEGASSTNESTVTIIVNPEPPTPLIITNSLPSGLIPFSTTINLAVLTNDNANCRYDHNDLPFESMNDFFTTGGTLHTEALTLEGGQTYNYYVRCQDVLNPNNETAEATLVSFTVEEDESAEQIEITDWWPTSQLDPTTSTSLYIETNITANCRYSEFNESFDDMTNSLNPRASLTIHTKLIDVVPGQSYDYYVHCQSADDTDNVTQAATHLAFSIGSTFEITKHPQSLTVIDGLLATFSVETNVPENELAYEWYKDDVRLFGHTTSQLSVIDADPLRDQGEYHVKIFRYQSGQIIDVIESDKATLDFLDIDRLGGVIESISPHAQTVQVGQSASISVQTSLNHDDLMFYWFRNGRLLLEHIYSPTITIPPVDLTDDNSFYQVAVFPRGDLTLWVDVSTRSAINVVP